MSRGIRRFSVSVGQLVWLSQTSVGQRSFSITKLAAALPRMASCLLGDAQAGFPIRLRQVAGTLDKSRPAFAPEDEWHEAERAQVGLKM